MVTYKLSKLWDFLWCLSSTPTFAPPRPARRLPSPPPHAPPLAPVPASASAPDFHALLVHDSAASTQMLRLGFDHDETGAREDDLLGSRNAGDGDTCSSAGVVDGAACLLGGDVAACLLGRRWGDGVAASTAAEEDRSGSAWRRWRASRWGIEAEEEHGAQRRRVGRPRGSDERRRGRGNGESDSRALAARLLDRRGAATEPGEDAATGGRR
ncbi:hypothetical protein ACP4OV_023463 [Aristida adscensionis]